MSDRPDYQSTAMPWTDGIMMPSCKTCGAVVMDQETHTLWHERIAVMLDQRARLSQLGRDLNRIARETGVELMRA